jgi:hypothetical protein
MDETTLLKSAGLTTSGIAIVLIVYRVFKLLAGKKLVSSCCGKRAEIGFDVVEMSPHPTLVTIENPIQPKTDLKEKIQMPKI